MRVSSCLMEASDRDMKAVWCGWAHGVHLRALTSSTTWRGTAREAGEEAGESVSRQARRNRIRHTVTQHSRAGTSSEREGLSGARDLDALAHHTTEVESHRPLHQH